MASDIFLPPSFCLNGSRRGRNRMAKRWRQKDKPEKHLSRQVLNSSSPLRLHKKSSSNCAVFSNCTAEAQGRKGPRGRKGAKSGKGGKGGRRSRKSEIRSSP